MILARILDINVINTQTQICQLVEFIGQSDHRVKTKANENLEKYLDVTVDLKKICEI